jgi:NAD(P)-dependent dehydrogenase (short-subunit alcohol dehydrogenase family)
MTVFNDSMPSLAKFNESMPSLVAFDLESVCTNPRAVVADDSNMFAGKVLLISGAGGQFGREGCLYFGRRGARIAALDQNKAGLKETFEEMETELGEEFDFMPYVCDVTKADQIEKVIESIVHRFKRIDFLWNNAGYQGKIEPTLDYDPQDFALVMNINVTGELSAIVVHTL